MQNKVKRIMYTELFQTCPTETSETLVDDILASSISLIREAKVLPAPFIDPDLVFISLGLKKKRSKPVYITTRSYNKDFDPDSFLVDLNCAPWSVIDCFEDVDDKLNAFNLFFNPPLDYHAPIKKIKLRSRPNPCVTDEIRSLIRIIDYWRKIARNSNDPLDWAAYKNFEREVKRELRLDEREHAENQIINNPNNPSCVCKTIRSCIPRKFVKKKSFSDSETQWPKSLMNSLTLSVRCVVPKASLDRCSLRLTSMTCHQSHNTVPRTATLMTPNCLCHSKYRTVNRLKP